MADIKVFYDVTSEIFACVKTKSKDEHGTVYDPPNGNSGTATTTTSLYFVELGFNFDPQSGDLTYTLIKKSWLVPISEVWNGIAKTIDTCLSIG